MKINFYITFYTLFTVFMFKTFFITSSFCFDYSESLFAYYSFNGNAMNAIDSKIDGNQQNVSFVNNRRDESSRACQFSNPDDNNSTSYIELPNVENMFNLENATISVWFKYDTIFTDYGAIIAKPFNIDESNSGNSFILYSDYKNRQLVFTLRSKDEYFTIITDLPKINEWHNIIASWGNPIKGPPEIYMMVLYIDGSFIESKSIMFGINYDNSQLLIGADHNFETNSKHAGFNGVIDDIRIYNQAIVDTAPLTNPEISLPFQLYECKGLYQIGFDEGLSFAKQICYDNPLICNINNSGLYSEQDLLDRINKVLKWDVNKDNQIGLHEVIQILKDTTE